ncbi:MAG: ABC transporter permease [Pelosinus sp.]|nr:ABC transporter permease [Pelosinus sp.]
MLQIIMKSLQHRMITNLALLASIAAGVCLIFSVTLIQFGVSDGLEKARQRLGADILVVPSGASVDPGEVLYGGAPSNIYMKNELEQEVANLKGVKRVTAQFFTQSLDEDCCDLGVALRMIGYDPKTDWLVQPWLENVSKRELVDNEVIIGSGVTAAKGNNLTILGKEFHVVAVMEPSGTGLDRSILTSISTARKTAANSPLLKNVWQKNGEADKLISAILVEVEPGADVREIIVRLETSHEVRAFSASETKRRIYEQFLVVVGLLAASGIVALVASMIQLFTRLYTLTVERQGEWGLYLAIGATPRKITLLIIVEAGILCSLGAAGGLILGYLLYLWSVTFISTHQAFPFVYPGLGLMGVTAAGIYLFWLLVTVFAAWIPIYRGGHIEPTLVMTRGEFD